MFIRTERSIAEFIRFYPIVFIILVINLLLWIIISLLQLKIGEFIYLFGVGHNLSVQQGEYWRLVTPIFLHAGLTHVAFNSFALVLFGPALERMLGKVTFSIAYFVTGIAGNFGTYIIDPTSITPHLGASGALYGLFGIYMYMVYFRKDLIDPRNAQIVQTIFLIGLIMTFIQPNVNIAAHIFGFIGGFAIGPTILKNAQVFSVPIRISRRTESNNDIRFDQNRWKRKRLIPYKLRKHIIWIIFGILVLLGLLNRYF